MKRYRISLLKKWMMAAAVCLIPVLALSQTAPTEGMKDNTYRVHAFTGADVVTSPGNKLTNATIIIRNGVIESVGTNVSVPADARVWDMQGKTIYPGFIDAYSTA